MLSTTLQQFKSTLAVKAKLTPVREFSRRTMHGGTGWTAPVVDSEHYQPQDQDGASATRISVAEIGAKKRRLLAGEPEDARLTGGTRSLMRRLMGLNVARMEQRKSPEKLPLTAAATTQVA